MHEPSPDTAVLIDGPDWWGDPSVTPEGRPVRPENAADRSTRRSAANLEREALEAAVAALPAGCLVLHTAGRGAGALAGAAASRSRLPVAAWPPFPNEDGIWPRNRAVVAALVGLAAAGWLVKAIIAVPDGDDDAVPDQHELVDLLRSHAVHVRYISPADAPSLAPEPEAPEEAATTA